MADYIKIPTDFFESNPISTIASLCGEGSDEIVLFYIHLLCETHKPGKQGVFKVGNIVLTDFAIGAVFPYRNVGRILSVLEQFGLIKRNERSIEVFKFWDDVHDRNSDQYKKWRMEVFKRDGFQCQKCGSKKDIQAHHIKAWKSNKSLRYVVSNGVTLCRKCHLDAHGGCWRNG